MSHTPSSSLSAARVRGKVPVRTFSFNPVDRAFAAASNAWQGQGQDVRILGILGVTAALALAGCANVAADMALRDAQAGCAKEGKQFVQDKVDKTEMIVVSAAQVSGHCVGPGDPAYVPPKEG